MLACARRFSTSASAKARLFSSDVAVCRWGKSLEVGQKRKVLQEQLQVVPSAFFLLALLKKKPHLMAISLVVQHLTKWGKTPPLMSWILSIENAINPWVFIHFTPVFLPKTPFSPFYPALSKRLLPQMADANLLGDEPPRRSTFWGWKVDL